MEAAGADQFVHLHVHSEYSMLDGAARVDELFTEAARMGMPALAMTDHGNVFGAYEFWKKGKAKGVKPIIGMEAYITPGTSRYERTRVRWAEGGEDDVSGGGAFTHMTLLAETTAGMHNLFRLASRSSLEGYFYKPRADRELISEYAAGLIASTGCPSGEIQTKLRIGDYEGAKQVAGELQDIFGRESFFCELMDHGLDIETRVHSDLLRLARELSMPTIATNDLHYTFAKDAEAHEVLLCVQSGKTMADPNRFKFDAKDFYLKSPEEMRRLWREVPEACDNTLLIAQRCDVAFDEGAELMPRFDVPAGETEDSWLRGEVHRGLDARFHGAEVPAEYRERADFELGVIIQMGFPGYFLVVADLCRHARDSGIRVGPGRGSAAGSLVAWALRITELDPIMHGLLFERFLNPERISMPDIDLDFDERRRGDMIRYATEKYGEDRVSQIITYSTIKAKAAVKDAARVLGFPYGIGDKITKVMPPPVMGKDLPLAAIFDPAHERYGEGKEFRQLYETEHDVKRVVDTARGLEGLRRQWGVHAAGVILSRYPLLDVIPIQRREADGAIITQFDMGACESLGLLKMDFLGLRNLTVLDDALRHIETNRGEKLDLENLPLDRPEAYELLCRGDTVGVFQFEGGPMRSLIRSLQPSTFEDIAALNALYRPGPMGMGSHLAYVERKHGRQKIEPIHPEFAESLADLLAETYGVIVYQEQVMAIAQRVAGYSLAQADSLRRAMGKKKKEILDKEKVPFSDGMKAHGYSQPAIDKLWETLIPFADYAFNKSHAAGYGLVSYWTAYLKAKYPAEYMAALLTSVRDDKDKSALYLHECRRMGIKVLPPDVNSSDADFAPVGTDIRYGMAGIRNVGTNVVASICATRRSKGMYADFADFLTKVEPVVCNKKVVESLVKAGAFDSLGHTRQGLLRIHAEAIDACMDTKRNEAVGQFDLFSAGDGDAGSEPTMALNLTIPMSEWDKSTLLAYEREMLGLYVSDHPLFGIEHVLAAAVDCPISALSGEDRSDGQIVTVGGIISSLTRKMTKRGDSWATAVLEDLEGAIEVLFFPKAYEEHGIHLAEDAVLLVRARIDKREEAPRLMAMEVAIPDVSQGPRGPVVITLPANRCTPPVVERLKEVLAGHPGATEVHLSLLSAGRSTVVRIDDRLRVAPTPALMADLKQLLGPNAVS
ncbi:MAG TPA: DNA polymerase III subunit alpha [Mycobacteriales bacterium]|nr:DNA polymerase III subunit alpha [Mycobacteriales bacterium]